MEFAAGILEKRAAKANLCKTEHERALISVGIISQVRLKTLEAMKALEEFGKASDLLKQAQEALRVAKEVERAKERGAGKEVMRIARQKAVCAVQQAEIDRLMALGEVHAALADLDANVGTNFPVGSAHPCPKRGPLPRLFNRIGLFVGSLKPW